MSNPEQTSLSPEEQLGLTSEQIALMEQGLDPLSQETPAAGTGPVEAGYAPAQEQRTDDRAEAIEHFATVEQAAINAAPKTEASDVLSVTEEVQKIWQVNDARKKIENMFGQEAAIQAHTTAIEHSNLQTKEAGAVATAIETGQHELPSSKDAIDPRARGVDNASQATTQFNKLKDKIDGRASTVLDKVAERTNHRLGKLGIHKKKKDLAAEAVEAEGEHLAEDSDNLETQRQLAGEAVAGALIDNKPGMSGASRKALLESLANDPAARKQVLAAARSYRDGVRNLHSFGKAGKALERLK